MKHNKIKKLSNALIIIFGSLSLATLILCIGGGGVVNDLYFALEEIEKNEAANITSLSTPQFELLQATPSARKQYLKETEANLDTVVFYHFIFIVLLFLSVILRVAFIKKKDSVIIGVHVK